VLGLNPHAGDSGLLGQEELEIIQPVVDEFRAKGHLVFGPYPADGFFGKAQFKEFDGVLGMYHDQGLIPFKYIAFDSGVNFTAGLPIIRTSPDHGTAYDIAGTNVADPGSFLQAIFLALDLVKNRMNA
jgi:4-hydroxythreonine-4-phosphate dehydrogenase